MRASSVSVSAVMLLQAAQAVFLPHPRNCEVVSHPVRLWKRGSAKDFNGPILYWSGWYILECHDNVFLYQSPPKALIGQETQNT